METTQGAPSGSEPSQAVSSAASSSSKQQEKKPKRKRVLSRRGCLTCKARKVKCDEGRPACRRCVAAGRTCEGYGIWGGGGTYTNTDGQSQSSGSNPGSPQGRSAVPQESGEASGTFPWTTSQTSPQPIPAPAFADFTSALYAEEVPTSLCPVLPSAEASIPVTSVAPGHSLAMEDMSSLNWLPTWSPMDAPVDSAIPFHNNTLHRACQVEPLVMSAVTTLTPIHQGDMGQWSSTPLCQFLTPTVVPVSEQYVDFIMRQYSQTLGMLGSQAASKRQEINSLELILASCVLLVSLELLQGSPDTAFRHLQSGLSVLETVESSGMVGVPRIQGWILDSLRKFWLQFELLHLFSSNRVGLPLPLSLRGPDNPQQGYFDSEEDAWTQLQGILIDAVVLHRRTRQMLAPAGETEPVTPWPGTHSYDATFTEQSRVLHMLTEWNRRFGFSFLSSYYGIRHNIMLAYRGLVSVLVTASTYVEDEMIYDSLTNQFLDIETQAREAVEGRRQMGPQGGVSVSSVADLGFIIPLYVTAIKCRNGSVRQRAIQLLGMITHKEGAWEPRSACAVAKEVVKLEGQNLQDFVTGSQVPSEVDTSAMAIMKEERRCSEVNVVVDGPEVRIDVKRGGEWIDTMVFIA